MTYLVLARKYRPRSFDTLIGQDHVVRALTHALDSQRLHHAWLFTGTRGVGKTTLSRILAKSLNCEIGITSKPCGVCRACTEIDAGRFVDYLELDAASNRGVDEMTQLLEQAVYAPSIGRYKVYMIDEVHMLTGHAFNAMLKTLEEPPPHVKFILATTDPQKIPATVLSRCLQFNLKQMPPESIVGHLQEVLGLEEIAAETPALRLIAQAAGGSMRDALSLTDQAIAYSASNLTDEAVRGMLGTIDQRHLVRLLEALASQEASAVLDIANELSTRGLSYSGALADLAVLLSRVAIEQRVPGVTPDDDPVASDIIRLATLLHPDRLQLFYSVAVHSRGELALAPDEYAGFIMACLRMLALAGEGEEGAMPTPPARKPARQPAGVTAATPVAARTAPAASASMPAPVQAAPVQAAPVQAAPIQAAQIQTAPLSAPLKSPPPWDVGPAAAAPGVPVGETSIAAGEPAPAAPPPEPVAASLRDPEPLATVPDALPASSGMDPATQALAAVKAMTAPASVTAPERAAPSAPAAKATAESGAPTVLASSAAVEPQSAKAIGATAADHTPPSWVDESIPDDRDGDNFASSSASSANDDDLDARFGMDDRAFMASADDEDEFETLSTSAMPASERLITPRASPPPPLPLAGRPAAPAARRARKGAVPRITDMTSATWPALAATLPVSGLAGEVARQSEWSGVSGSTVTLRVAVKTLADSASRVRLQTVLCEHFGQAILLDVILGTTGDETAHAVEKSVRAAQQVEAEQAVAVDPFVCALVADFGGRVIADSIRYVDAARAA